MARVSSYEQILTTAAIRRYVPSGTTIEISRRDLEDTANELGFDPKNIGDIPYTFRYRRDMPQALASLAPAGLVWIIKGVGDGLYQLRAVAESRIAPSQDIVPEGIADRSHPLVRQHRTQDEQAMLALVQDNGLLGRFFGHDVHRIQSHLRTKVPGIGQIEIDDLYVGQDEQGRELIIPVQAKGGKDRPGAAQTLQDIAGCAARYPGLICRPVSIHYAPATGRLAFLELHANDDVVSVVREQHFFLL